MCQSQNTSVKHAKVGASDPPKPSPRVITRRGLQASGTKTAMSRWNGHGYATKHQPKAFPLSFTSENLCKLMILKMEVRRSIIVH